LKKGNQFVGHLAQLAGNSAIVGGDDYDLLAQL
jgi:hypothetical protein